MDFRILHTSPATRLRLDTQVPRLRFPRTEPRQAQQFCGQSILRNMVRPVLAQDLPCSMRTTQPTYRSSCGAAYKARITATEPAMPLSLRPPQFPTARSMLVLPARWTSTDCSTAVFLLRRCRRLIRLLSL